MVLIKNSKNQNFNKCIVTIEMIIFCETPFRYINLGTPTPFIQLHVYCMTMQYAPT